MWPVRMRAGARAALGRAGRGWLRARDGGAPTWGQRGGEEPGIQRPATSVPGLEPVPRAACGEGPVLCWEVTSGKRRPGWAHRTDQRLGEPLTPSGEGLLVCFKLRAPPDIEISDPSLENSNVFVSIGSAPNLTLQTTMKNQDKRNGPAKQSGNTSNPKNTPGQPEAGPEGAQGRPSQSAPATEAEGSTSQAAGKAEGVCQLCFSNAQGEEFVARRSSFWN